MYVLPVNSSLVPTENSLFASYTVFSMTQYEIQCPTKLVCDIVSEFVVNIALEKGKLWSEYQSN